MFSHVRVMVNGVGSDLNLNILRRKSLVSTDTVCNNFVRQPLY